MSENTKVVALAQCTESDPDIFIRLCNSHSQQLRRQHRMKVDRRKRMALVTAKNLLVALGGAAVATGILNLIF